MIYYYGLAAIFSVFALTETVKDREFLKPVLWVYGFILLFVFAALRYDEFSDYKNYVKIFEEVYTISGLLKEGSYSEGIHGEYLFLLLNSVVKSFTSDATYVFILVAFFSVAINLYCYKKYSPYVLVSTLLYFSHIYLYKELLQIRNGLASALVLLSVIYIQRRQLYRFLLIIGTAGLFHIMALAALPMYYLCKINWSRGALLLTIILGMGMAQFSWIHGFISLLSSHNLAPAAVTIYVGVETQDYPLTLYNPVTLKQILVCVLAIYYKDVLSVRLPYFYPLLIMYVMSTAWIIAANEFAIIAARIASVLSGGDVIIIPSLALLFKQKRLVLLLIILYALAVFYINIGVKEMWPPYRSILFL